MYKLNADIFAISLDKALDHKLNLSDRSDPSRLPRNRPLDVYRKFEL